jgi:uncharacterized membrane protein
MEELLYLVAGVVALAIELVAILVVAYGSILALIGVIRLVIRPASNAEKRQVWMNYAQWLITGLTFQLAADIVSTTVAPTWDQIGRVAAIAAIRTLLTFFLDRDIEEIRKRDEARRRFPTTLEP